MRDTPIPGQDTLVWNFATPFGTDGGSDGEYTVQVSLVDKAGNRTEPPLTIFFFDTTPPSIDLDALGVENGLSNRQLLVVNPPDGEFLNTSIKQVSVTLTDPAGIDLVASSIELQGPVGLVAGRQTHNGVDTLFWEFAPLQTDGGDDGKYQIRLLPVDTVGNTAVLPLTFTFTYDTRPPVITQSFPRAGEIVTSSLEAVTVGLSEDGGAGIDLANSAVKFFLKIGSGPLVTVPGVQSNDGVDTLIFTLDGPLASDGSDDGAYQVEVIPQDVLGNTPQTPETFEFTYAVRAPALVSTTPEAGSLLNETLNQVVAVLRDRSGTGLDLVTFTLTLRKAPFGGGLSQVVAGALRAETTDASAPGVPVTTFTFTLEDAFATDGSDDGVYTIEVTGVDNLGSTAVYPVDFLYDTESPRVVQVSPADGSFLNVALNVVSAQLTDDGTAVDLQESTVQFIGPGGEITGRQTNDGRDTVNWEFTPLATDGSADGLYTIKVVPVDILGNGPFTPFESQFNLDTRSPQVSTEPAPGAQLQRPIRRVEAALDDGMGRGIDIDASHISVFDPLGVEVPGTQANDGEATIFWEFDSALADDGSADGTYTIQVVSQDILGNRSVPLTFTFEYRSKTPLLVDITPEDEAALSTPIEAVSARLQDQSGTGLNLVVSSILVTGPGVSPDDEAGNNGADTFFWTFANPLATDGSDDGGYTVAITAVPNLGGRATYTTTFTYDTTPPAVVSTTPSEGTVLVTGISEVTAILADGGGRVDLKRSSLQLVGPAGRVLGAQTDNGFDTLKLTFDLLSVDGEYALLIQPWDAFGNTLPTAQRFQFLLDTTPPGIVTTEPSVGDTLVVPIDEISVTFSDAGAGVDVEQSTVRLVGPNGFVVGEQKGSLPSEEGIREGQSDVILTWEFTQALSADGSDDGMYEMLVSPVDQVGNALDAPLRFSFTYTTRAPGVASSTPADGAVLNTALEDVSVVFSDNSGAGIDFTRTQVLVIGPNGPVNRAIEGDGVRTLELTLDDPLIPDGQDDGEYTLQITAFDQTGAGAQYTRRFTYDTTPPTVVALRRGEEGDILSLATASPFNTSFSSVEAVLADEGVGLNLVGSTIQLSGPRGNISGTQTSDGEDTIRLEFQSIPADGSADGVYTVRATPRDGIGNVDAETLVEFIYDTTPPRIISTVPKADSVLVTSIDRIALVLDDGSVGTGIDFANTTVSLSGPNGEIPGVQTDDGVGTIFFSFAPLALDETARGSYQITVVPQDGVGNRGAAQMFSFTYQPTAPILAGTQLRFVSASRSVDFEDGAKFAEPPSQITVTLTDQSGTGVNFEASSIQVIGPKGLIPGLVTDNGVDTMDVTFDRFLATDGTDDGAYTIRVTSQDNRENRATYTIGFLYDTTPPEVTSTVPQNGAILNTKFDRVAAGLADAHAGVDLTRSSILLMDVSGATITGEQRNNGLDTIQLQFASPIPPAPAGASADGVYTIIVKPEDVLGNTPPDGLQFRFLLDTTRPRVLKTEPADGVVLVNTRLTQVSAVLDDGQNASGIDMSQSTIRLTGPKGEVQGAMNPDPAKEGVLTLVFDPPLSLDGTDDGRYIITVEAFDQASNHGAPHQSSFFYDTVQPGGPAIQKISVQPAAFSPNDDGASDTTRISYTLSNPATVTIQVESTGGSAPTSLSLVRILMDGVPLDAGEQSLLWDGRDASGLVLPDSIYTLTFTARDARGLTSPLESVNVLIDTQSPILSNLTLSDNPFTPNGDGFADVLRIQFTVTNASPQDNAIVTFHDALGDQITLSAVLPSFAGDGTYSATWNGIGAPVDGEYGYTIHARDSAGNGQTRSGTVVRDRDGPTVTVIEPAMAREDSQVLVETNLTPLVLRGVATDFSGVQKVEVLVRRNDAILLGGRQPLTIEAPEAQQSPVQWQYQFDPPDDGTYTFTIRATDNVGHRASPSVPVRIAYDTAKPQHLSTRVNVGGQAEPSSPPQTAKNGESVQLIMRWDAPGYHVTADFSELDTQFTGEVTGMNNGDSKYLLTYQISTENRAPDGLKTVRITAIDPASNETVIDVVAVELDNTAPRIEDARSLDSDTVYRNGETVQILVRGDARDYLISADFSPIDPNYQSNAEKVTNNGDNTYTIQYQIQGDNPRSDGDSLPIIISASDGVHTTTTTLTVQLDNTPPIFGRVTATDKTYSNGQTATLLVNLDSRGYALAADFSDLDSTYAKAAETVLYQLRIYKLLTIH